MLRKTLIGTLVLALTPALAFAAPAPMAMKERPAVTHTVKLQKKTHVLRKVKAEKIRLIQKHRTVQKMKVAARIKHRTLTHKI
jgi:hypothetical protein